MLTLTLMEDNSINKKSSKLFLEINKTEVKKSKNEIEQFSERLSTALRRNRNPLNFESAANESSNRLFTKVFTNENDSNTFKPELILKTQNNGANSLGEYLNNNSSNSIEENVKRKDSWSLNECLQEINSIRYDNFVSEISNNKDSLSPKVEKSNSRNVDAAKNGLNFYYKNERQERSRRSSFSSVKSEIDLLSSEEDELLFREEEGSITSSRSSISWAADAIEAKLTLQLAKHWEEIELVCSGQLKEQPESMSDAVYEECLLWKRAFPEKSENPSRFSTMAVVDEEEEEENESTPTPTNTQILHGFHSAIRSARSPNSLMKFNEPDFDFESRAENCVTPNPNNSSEYVTAWLTENHPYHQQFSFEQTEPEIFQNETLKNEKHSAQSYNSLNTNISFTRRSNSPDEQIIIKQQQSSSMKSVNNNRNNSGNSSKHNNSAKHRILNDLITNQGIQSNTVSSFSRFSNQFGTENLQSKASPKKSTLEPFLLHSNNLQSQSNIGGSNEYKDESIIESLINSRPTTNSGVIRQRPNNLRFRTTTNNSQLMKSNELETSPTKPPFLLWLFDKS